MDAATGAGLSEAEARRTLQSASDAGLKSPRQMPAPKATATQPPNAKATNEGQPETTAEARGPYALNEIGNGKRFADANRGRYLFDYTANRWRVYIGGVWRHTDGDDVERAAKVIEAQICDEARGEADDDRRAKLYKHAATITKRKTRETMLKDAASELGMSAPPECFDAQLHLFNVQNGTLDLKTGELKPHNATDLLTKCAGTKFDPHATAPTWTRALETWMPDAATRDYLQECAGLSLSGEVRDEFFNFLFGGGANGKTTFLSTLESVSGDYYRHAKAEIFMRSKFARDGEASTPGLLSLQGARLLTVSEIEGEHEMSAALVKGLTGRDPITARGNYDKRPTTFRPQFTLWMFGNEKPKIADASEGMWRRVRLIEFNQVIPKADRDPDFAEKLEAELSGVLNWALDGLKRVQQRGLIVPEAVSVSTASYRAEQDTLSGFLADMCEQSPTAFVPRTELWEAWKAYCVELGEPEGTQEVFNLKLRKQGPKDTRQYIGGRQTRVWEGLRLK
jgi:putative DNA primase/helicase